MRAGILTAILGLSACAATAADPAPAVPDTHKPLQGFWRPESIVYDGAEMLNPQAKAALALVIKGTEYRAYYCTDPQEGKYLKLFAAELTLDPVAKTFELAVKEGQKKGEKRHGVYEVAGSNLRLCYGPTDRPRPAGFDAGKGSGLFVETWRLDKR